jgi:mannose-1-phosphate guanylyltransferase
MNRKPSSRDFTRAAIILAGGDGKRLGELTQKIVGFQLPKQFRPVLGELPLLEQTRRRVSQYVRPDLISFVLTRDHERFFTPLLTEVSAENMVVQPCNRGTAPAILYSLLRLAELTPDSSVLLMPSDHHVADEGTLTKYVDLAFAAIEERPELTLLLGVVPDQAETGYGWSLWNSFMIVGRVSTLLGLFIIAMPRLYLAFSKIRPTLGTCFEDQTVSRLYERIASADFSRHILEAGAVNLAVLRVSDIGWTDLGEPDRLIKTIASLGIQQKWAAA